MELKPKYDVKKKVVKGRFNDKHIYIVDGEEYESVTKIVDVIDDDKSARLINWAKKQVLSDIEEKLKHDIGNNIVINNEYIKYILSSKNKDKEKKDLSAEWGTNAHNAIEMHIKGENKEKIYDILESIEATNAYNSWVKMIEDHKISKFITSELPIVSKELKFGGTLDCIALHNDKLCLLDWKTSNSMRTSYYSQIGGYIIAFEEQFYPLKIESSYICIFNKDFIEYKMVEIEPETSKKFFINTINLKNMLEIIKEKINE